jgi:hypothetical protein
MGGDQREVYQKRQKREGRKGPGKASRKPKMSKSGSRRSWPPSRRRISSEPPPDTLYGPRHHPLPFFFPSSPLLPPSLPRDAQAGGR